MINVDRVQPSLPSRVAITAAKLFVRSPGAVLPLNWVGVLGIRAMLFVACRVFLHRMEPHLEVDVVHANGRTRGEWVGRPPTPGTPILYFLHGSGYVGCSPASHRGLVSELTRRLSRPAFTLRYRRAPEHRFPAAHLDTLNGYLWLLEQGHDPRNIIVAGDSAGGHLALGLLVQLRDRGVPQPAAVVGFSALVDPTWELAREREPEVSDAFMAVHFARRVTGLYTNGDEADPLLKVIAGVGPDLPPILLQAGGSEVLSADAEHYVAAQLATGGWAEVRTWPGMFHVFQMGYPLLPEARAALGEVERFVARVEAEAPEPMAG